MFFLSHLPQGKVGVTGPAGIIGPGGSPVSDVSIYSIIQTPNVYDFNK